MNDEALLIAFGAATFRVATPLLLAALGETISERGGVLNLGIEGSMLAGAFAAALGATSGGVWFGTLMGIAAGALAAMLLVIVSVWLRGDQIIAGTAITLAAFGVTGLLAATLPMAGDAAIAVPGLGPVAIPVLSRIPLAGPILFNQSPLTWLALLMAPICWWLLFRTRFGLELRASGESPAAAAAAGVRVTLVRSIGTLIGGALAGLAGAALVLAQVGSFTERMTAGRGFIAIAIVVLGRWHPALVLPAALLFGACSALQYLFQAAGTPVPYQLMLALPYLMALLVLAVFRGRSEAPAGLAKNAPLAD
jgi:ABC-type uncharacterized transport system permease subunit